jgi:hypothetical protein
MKWRVMLELIGPDGSPHRDYRADPMASLAWPQPDDMSATATVARKVALPPGRSRDLCVRTIQHHHAHHSCRAIHEAVLPFGRQCLPAGWDDPSLIA